jgi:hypothetical protein
MPKCPGQDKYYWTPDDVFDVACPACGEPIEFFKTDPMRRCPSCRYASPNPRLDAGCAQWCPHAELCVGVKLAGAAADEAGTVRLVDRLLAAARDHLGRGREQIVRSLTVLQQAQEALAREPDADPRAVLAAAVLLDSGQPERGTAVETEAAHAEVMSEAGFDDATVEQVAALLRPGGLDADTPEARVLRQVSQPVPTAAAAPVAGQA